MSRAGASKTIVIEGARENNLRDIRVELPRESLVVITGMSGSGKSSLAFETLYAEGQRRLMESMSAYAKRFVSRLKKPDVDFVTGLSPVISIDQKTVSKNPRSTVGTMTDIYDYLRMLFATVGRPRCPHCEEPVRVMSPGQMMEHVTSLPDGTEVEIRAPVQPIFGEDLAHLCEQVRAKGYRRARIDGRLQDLGEDLDDDLDPSGSSVEEEELDAEALRAAMPHVEAIIDRFVVGDPIDKELLASLEHGLKLGEGFLSFHVVSECSPALVDRFYGRGQPTEDGFDQRFGCAAHRAVAGTMHHGSFTFNDPEGACVTCSGLGVYLRVHPPLLVPDPRRSLRQGAIAKQALGYDKNSWGGRMLHSLSLHYDFSLDTPFEELAESVRAVIFYGTQGEKITLALPPGAQQGREHVGKEVGYVGCVNQLENSYRWYRKRGESREGLEDHFRKVMVEHHCPDCGGARLKRSRMLVTVGGKSLHQLGEMHLGDLLPFLQGLSFPEHQREVARKILKEMTGRLGLLVDIGLDYLSLNRRSGTLSGGESQRIRLSTQIGSGLMGMLYVLDEPSIGLHPKDNQKMIATLRRLRDLGNTVIVVEHDEETIRAADHIVEIGPGPGIHGGKVVASCSLAGLLTHPDSLTGAFLSGRRGIAMPKERRPIDSPHLLIRGARHNNLKNIDVRIPLGVRTAITGASGSGKSSLIHEVLFKALYNTLHDSRVLPGDHDEVAGMEQVDQVIDIDQSPIGRSPRSNPATYIGFYDNIRKAFAATEGAKKRRFTSAHFSFNVKGGRCEECSGQGTITTKLAFMPDVEVTCPSCKGARYQQSVLEVELNHKNIHQVLETSIEEGVEFFAGIPSVARKLRVLNDLGLGYLKIGHPATVLSGGEAQRVKLASELAKVKRGKSNLYILDEPTTGLHLADIQRLLDCLDRLVAQGHTVVVIEHHADVIKTSDYVVDLGPEGGHKGGRVLVAGTPEQVADCAESHTGRFLAPHLG